MNRFVMLLTFASFAAPANAQFGVFGADFARGMREQQEVNQSNDAIERARRECYNGSNAACSTMWALMAQRDRADADRRQREIETAHQERLRELQRSSEAANQDISDQRRKLEELREKMCRDWQQSPAGQYGGVCPY